jgi:hypothetical protein
MPHTTPDQRSRWQVLDADVLERYDNVAVAHLVSLGKAERPPLDGGQGACETVTAHSGRLDDGQTRRVCRGSRAIRRGGFRVPEI